MKAMTGYKIGKLGLAATMGMLLLGGCVHRDYAPSGIGSIKDSPNAGAASKAAPSVSKKMVRKVVSAAKPAKDVEITERAPTKEAPGKSQIAAPAKEAPAKPAAVAVEPKNSAPVMPQASAPVPKVTIVPPVSTTTAPAPMQPSLPGEPARSAKTAAKAPDTKPALAPVPAPAPVAVTPPAAAPAATPPVKPAETAPATKSAAAIPTPPVSSPSPPSAAAPGEDRLQSARLIAEGRKLFERGQVIEARRRYIAALNSLSPEATFALAQTFDTHYLAKLPASDGAPDVGRAFQLYTTAVDKGLKEAEPDLARLRTSLGLGPK